MNKLFTKIATAFVGIAMAVGVGVAVGNNTNFVKAEAGNVSLAISSDVTNAHVKEDSNSDAVDAVKCNKAGTLTITVPKEAGDVKVYYHIAAWKDEGSNASITFTNASSTTSSVSVTANANISGSSLTWTLGQSFENYKKEISITKGAQNVDMQIKITAASGKRLVLWDAYYVAASAKNCKAITVTAPRNYVYIGQDIELGYTATDVDDGAWTGDVTYSIASPSSAGVASLTGNVLTGEKEGTVVIQAADTAGNAVTKTTKTITVKEPEDLPLEQTYTLTFDAANETSGATLNRSDDYMLIEDTDEKWNKTVSVSFDCTVNTYKEYVIKTGNITFENNTNGYFSELEIKFYNSYYQVFFDDSDTAATGSVSGSIVTFSNLDVDKIKIKSSNTSTGAMIYYAKATVSTKDYIKNVSIKDGTSLTKGTQASGSIFDPSGLTFVVDYRYANDAEIGSPYTGFVWGSLVANAGKVTGTYTDANDLTATIDVPVTIINDTLAAIAFDVVNSNMSKKEYYTDDADFDFSGVIVSGTYSVTGAAADVTSNVTISADKTIAQLGRGKHTIKLSAVDTDNTDIATTSTYDVNIQIFAAKSSILVEEVVANYDFTDSTVNSGSIVSKTNFDDQNKLSTNNLKTLSNVSYTYIGNTQAQGGESNRYGYIRMANGSNAGSFTVEFTKNVNKVIVEARRWSNNTASGFTLTVNNQEFEFTDKENHETHTFEFNTAKTIAFSAASGHSVFIYKMTFKYESNEKKSDDALALYRFSDNYLHMNDYDKELHVGQDGNNWCKDGEHHYYSDAYTYYTTTLTDAQRILFQNSAFANERARFVAWAAANSQTISFNSSTGAIQSNSGAVVFNLPAETNTVATFIAIIAVVSTLSVGGFFFIRKKKNVK